MTDLRGKIVLITGASSGIGRATALEFARRGANVGLTARRQEALDAVAADCRAMGVRASVARADVSSWDEVSRMVGKVTGELGAIDILVNNAGFAVFDPIEKTSPTDVEAMLQTNFLGVVYCTQAVLPSMLARGSGNIVNVASIAGLMGFFRMGAYCASKFAIIGFTEALRDEVLGRGVKVSMVCPGTVETEFFQIAERGKMPAANRLILAISPERVARAICRAASRGSYRIILPWTAAVFMKFKEIFPRTAHFLMRNVSQAIDRGKA